MVWNPSLSILTAKMRSWFGFRAHPLRYIIHKKLGLIQDMRSKLKSLPPNLSIIIIHLLIITLLMTVNNQITITQCFHIMYTSQDNTLHAYAGLWRIPSFLHFNYFFGPFLLFLLFNYFFMQFLLFNYFFYRNTFFLHSRAKNWWFRVKKIPATGAFFSPILCENCPLHFNYFFKVFQILLYGSMVIIHFGGYFFFAGEYIFCLYDVRIPIFSYFLTTFSSWIFLLFNYFFIMKIPSF